MATVYTWTDSVTEITWNYVTSGSDAIIGEDTGNFNASATTSGIGLNGNIIIPSTVIDSNNVSYTVTRIGKRAFAGASFQSITIPDTVTEISQQGISGCNGLTTVTFGNNSQCTTFGESAFYACNNLVSITLPNSLLSIGQSCFQNCKKLSSITIPASVTTFAGNAFAWCDLLVTVVFEEGIQLTSLGTGTFSRTAIQSITIPDSVTSIGSTVFGWCSALTSITIPDSVTSISSSSFSTGNQDLIVTMNTKTIDGTEYFSPTDEDEDISFFGNDSVTLVVPPEPPSMTIASTTTGVTSGSTTNNPSIALTFTSSEATIDFVVGDITVTNGALSAFDGSGTVYTATFTPTGQGACTIDISAGVYTDAATNLNNLATQFNWTFDLAAGGLSIAELLAAGFTQTQIDIALTEIKIHSGFTINEGEQNESVFVKDAVYTPTTFAAKLTTDLGYDDNPITVDIDSTTTDSTPYYRMYLEFAEAVTLTGMPKDIFNIPFSDFSVGAGGQVNLRNVNLDADMTINTSYTTDVSFGPLGADINGIEAAEGGEKADVSLSSDGSIVAIGAYKHDGGRSVDQTGVARIYKNKIPNDTEWSTANVVIKGDDTVRVANKYYWTQLGSDINGPVDAERFGYALALSSDGSIVAVGAINSNTARIYEYKIPTDTEWGTTNMVIKGTDPDRVADKYYWTQLGADIVGVSQFGYSISLSSDGSIVAVGHYPYPNTGSASKGYTKIYEYKIPNDTEWGATNVVIKGIDTDATQVVDKYYWTQLGADITGELENDLVGFSADLNGDGSIVAVGAYGFSAYRGSTRIYEYKIPNDTEWGTTNVVMKGIDTGATQVVDKYYWTKLGASIDGLTDGEVFGRPIALSSDGSIVASGAYAHGSGLGTARIYKYKIPTDTEWGTTNVVMKGIDTDATQVVDKYYWTQLGPDMDGGDGINLDRVGFSLGLSGDGSIVAISAYKNNSNTGTLRVYKYKIPTTTEWDTTNFVITGTDTTQVANKFYWTKVVSDINGDSTGENFGYSVSLSSDGNIVAGGANGYDNDRSSVRVYNLPHTKTHSNTSIIPANNYFINNFVSTIETDLVDYTLSYDASNALITFDGLSQDISMNIISNDTTIFDTTITEITAAANTLPFITYGQPDPTISQYIDNGITVGEFISNGVTIPQLLIGGFIPDWTFDTDANHLAQSYVKDFIDISGSLVLRENANLTVNGNIETKGNITIKNQIMAADLSLNHNMFVMGDISMNGNVTVGDVSMNGKVVDCSFTDSSIPASAFIGTMPGPDYTQPTILYEKGFDTTADVSMNANVQINNLKVDGNIEFSDGTTMDTFDDNKYYLAPAMSVTSFTNPIQSTAGDNSAYGDQVITVSSDGKYVMIEHGNLADGPSENNYYLDNASGDSGIALSTDYGITFTRVEFKHPDTGATLVNYNFSGAGSAMSYTGQHIITAISGSTQTTFTDAMIGLSADYGTTWTTKKILDLNGISDDYTDGYVGNIGIKHDGTTMAITIFGDDGIKTYISTDYGETWTFLTNIFTTLYSLSIMNDHFIGRGNQSKSLYIIDSSSTLLYTFSLSLYQDGVGRAQVSIPLKGNRIVIGDSGNGYYRITYDPNTSTYSSNLTNASWKTNSTISPSGQYIAIGRKMYVDSFKNGFNYSAMYFSNDYGETFAYLSNLSSSITGNYNTYSTSNAISDNGTWYACMYDNKMYRISLNALFKASTFTSLNIVGNLTAGSFPTGSDYRIKTDVSQLDEKVTLDNLRPVKYLQTILNKPQYGLIAHELQEYYPDLVVGEKDGKEWQRVNYTGLIALLINEIKQLKRDLVELENGM